MEHQFPVLLHPAERAAGWFAIQAPDNTLEPAIKAGDICYFDPPRGQPGRAGAGCSRSERAIFQDPDRAKVNRR